MARKTKHATTIDRTLTLGALCEAYLASLAERGQSEGTIFSYRMELKTAQAELGAETLVSDLTYAAIAAFNTSERVMKLKSGKPKAPPSFLKTRRTLRLCLAFAEQSGLIGCSPVSVKKDALPGQAESDATTPTKADASKSSTAKSKKTGKRRGAIVLEVSQEEAERAADAAEAMVAADANTAEVADSTESAA